MSGCLHSILGEKEEGNNVENTFRIKKRVCNSDDSLDGAIKRGECEASQFDYQEVRILSSVSHTTNPAKK